MGLGCKDAPELRHSRCEEVQPRGRSAGLSPLGAELRLAAAAARRGGGVGACCGGGVELVEAQLARAELVSVRVRVRVMARARARVTASPSPNNPNQLGGVVVDEEAECPAIAQREAEARPAALDQLHTVQGGHGRHPPEQPARRAGARTWLGLGLGLGLAPSLRYV